MKEKRRHRKQLKLAVPDQELPLSNFLTNSGTFQDGDLRLNKNGLQIIPREGATKVPDAKKNNFHFALEDLEILNFIGNGSGGVVKLVQHKNTGKLFALKAIQLNFEDKIRKQIVQELRINYTSHCPQIVLCYQSFYHNGNFSLILEYMDRGSVADILKQVNTIAEAELSLICKQVLEGLVYLHNERHVIHRDIKPSNLLVNKKGEVKISDFGVSAMLERSREERITVIGTCSYMSPERIMNCKYDYKSDIWSLGLVMLECAIGYFPYQPLEQERWSNIFELLEDIVNEPPPSAPEDRFSSEFHSFLSACLQKDPLRRMSAVDLLSHSYIKKYEDKNIDIEVLVGGLASPPLNSEG